MKWLAGLAVTGLLAVPALADPEVSAVTSRWWWTSSSPTRSSLRRARAL